MVRHHTYHTTTTTTKEHTFPLPQYCDYLFAVLPRMDESLPTVLPTNPCAPGDVFTSRISWEPFALEERGRRIFPFYFCFLVLTCLSACRYFIHRKASGQRQTQNPSSEVKNNKKSSPAKAAWKNIKPKLTFEFIENSFLVCFICNQSSTTIIHRSYVSCCYYSIFSLFSKNFDFNILCDEIIFIFYTN